jgi:membrane protein
MDRSKSQQEPATEEKPAPTRPWPIAKTVFQEFGRDNGTLMAASVAFYLLLSIIPLMLVGVSILGFFLNPARAADQAFRFLNQFIPVGKATINQAIEAVISARGSLGVAGLIGTALTATGGFATLENAINVLWNRPNRNFIMNKLLAFGMMLVVGVLFLLTMGTSAAIAAAEGVPGLAWLSSSWARPVLGVVIPLAISSLMFAVMYRVYPNGRVSWRSPLIAGFITAVLWEAFKNGYAFYAARDQSPYGIFVGLVMWIFYSAALILLGSELTWVLEGCPGKAEKEQVHASRGRAAERPSQNSGG